MSDMRKAIPALLFLVLLGKAHARSYSYDVSGTCNGEAVSGEIDATSGRKDVEGTLTYDDTGEQVSFEGEWVGKGEIEGEDENGNDCELEVD